MTPEDMFITCLLLAVWCIVLYIGNKHEHVFYGLALVVSILMLNTVMGYLSVLFIGISAYFVVEYIVHDFL